MAALVSLTQLSSGNPVYETYYRQVDPAHTGKVGPNEAALFLKKSGLSDVILGKIWDLADPEGKGYLDKQGFYVALRLVACAQNGHDVNLSSLNVTLPPPKFHDSSSPSLIAPPPSSDTHWAVRPEERAKFDGIFESLTPLNGLLSGDKVKPVLINSNLPLDVLGRVWDLSDVDKDGHLDRDEFAVAMHLVYRALEKEPVPSVLPPALLPPSKRKKQGPALAGSVPVLPASPPPKDSLRSTPSHGSINSLNSAGSISPKHIKQPVNWVVPSNDKMRYDDIFLKIDLDMDGYVSGLEVKDIFMQSALHQNLLAHIWSKFCCIRAWTVSVSEETRMVLNMVQSSVNIPTSDLLIEGRSLKKQLKMVGLRTLTYVGFVQQAAQNPGEVPPTLPPQDPANTFTDRHTSISTLARASIDALTMLECLHLQKMLSSCSNSNTVEMLSCFLYLYRLYLLIDPFGTLDPFGSSAFGSGGFADFTQMSKPSNSDPFAASGSGQFGGQGFTDDPFQSKRDTPALPPKKSVPPRPKAPPSGKSTPVNRPGSADSLKSHDPFQPFGADDGDPFQSKKGLGDPFSGKDPFTPTSSSKTSKDSSLGFADFSSFGNEDQQLEWAKRESERAERERLERLRRQEQEDLELAIALSKAEMSNV
ncbi:epidermal growth factor receptor substrate 15-like 1 [Mustelus asterias]